MRGRNKDFIVNGTIMILTRNYNIFIRDYQEIDCKLSIGENVSILRDKYLLRRNINEY
jgi:hypothetical protein